MSQRQIDELQRIYGGTTTKIKEEINRMHQYWCSGACHHPKL
ncbi:hypothetical protein AWH56_26980 [Anaerobacillus isosaccharinicus]|uniref:Uncharacterized protein n=1 Tax=Anaerobacillus isosaccharinicus TaxID=1532552 RepID=A0AC62A4K7_9BACI|nr:hypothetical protein [Anaerobacillus isosaccharinicus]